MEVEEKENEEEEEEEEKRGEEEEKESEDEGTKKVKGSSRKGSSRKSGRDSAEKKEPVTPSSDRPTRERKVVERKYLEDPCVWVESNNTTLTILSSHAEIGLGWLLIFSLFSWQRNIVQTFMYWQLLKLMYHAPVTAGYHQSVWAKIGRTINPLILRYAPFLNTPVSAIQKWWSR